MRRPAKAAERAQRALRKWRPWTRWRPALGQLWPAALEAQPVFALRGGGFAEAQEAEAQEQPFAPEPLEKREQWRKDLEADVLAAHGRWRKFAAEKRWGEVVQPLEVYRGLDSNPRTSDSYRAGVVSDLELDKPDRYPHLARVDLAAAQETFRRCVPGM